MTFSVPVSDRLRAVLERLAREGDSEAARDALAGLLADVVGLERELVELRSVLVTTSRLAELGRSAAAHNHELRQPALAIRALAELLQADAGDPEKVTQSAVLIHDQAARMARLLDAFRAESTGPIPAGGAADVATAVRRVRGVLEYRLRRRTTFTVDVAPGLPPVGGGADRLEQILLNLVVNALDAVDDRGAPGGVVVRALRGPGPREVQILVGDDGPGVPPEVRDRLYEPFFTTKLDRGGTGLGMAICRELSRDAGGRVELLAADERERLGPWPHPVRTAFRLVLPEAEGEAAEEETAAEA